MNIPIPECLSFEGNVTENWKRFKQRFDLYDKATENKKRNDEQKVALFLTIAGQEAVDVFNTLTFEDGQDKLIDVVVGKFEEYCSPRTNETYERFIFRKRIQKDGEKFESFLIDLKTKAKSCNFGDLKASLLRDQIVIGIADKKVRAALLKEDELSFEKSVKICQAAEAANFHLN